MVTVPSRVHILNKTCAWQLHTLLAILEPLCCLDTVLTVPTIACAFLQSRDSRGFFFGVFDGQLKCMSHALERCPLHLMYSCLNILTILCDHIHKHSVEIVSPLFDSCGQAGLNIGCSVAFWHMSACQSEGLNCKTMSVVNLMDSNQAARSAEIPALSESTILWYNLGTTFLENDVLCGILC